MGRNIASPTANSSAAFGPMPENRTMQPSGTAPSMGNTTLPNIHVTVWGVRDKEK